MKNLMAGGEMEFYKMEAAGNDFVIFNGLNYDIKEHSNLAIKVCDRHFSVGADGILICEKSKIADIKMLYYNSDGSKGEMCGNGIRCFSKYVYEEGLVKNNPLTVDTLAGIKKVHLGIENYKVKDIRVNMRTPVFDTKEIPVNIDKNKVIEETLIIDGKEMLFSSIFMGVPHTVIFVEDINNININKLGKEIEMHPIFPNKTNVNFVEIISKNKINIYTWERGAGRTLGCGTGSCASVIVGNLLNKLDSAVQVYTEGGAMEVHIIKDDYETYMKGNANTICKGVFLNLS